MDVDDRLLGLGLYQLRLLKVLRGLALRVVHLLIVVDVVLGELGSVRAEKALRIGDQRYHFGCRVIFSFRNTVREHTIYLLLIVIHY